MQNCPGVACVPFKPIFSLNIRLVIIFHKLQQLVFLLNLPLKKIISKSEGALIPKQNEFQNAFLTT